MEKRSSLIWLLLAVLFLGLNAGIMNSTFNNYLSWQFSISAATRGALEIPREIPGFLLIFLTGLISFVPLRTRGIMVGLMQAFGILGIGYFSPSLSFLIFWMILWSTGDHLWMPTESKMALNFATKGKEGEMLGRVTGARNLAQVLGTIAITIIFGYLFKENTQGAYRFTYALAFCVAIMASITFYLMRSDQKIHQAETKRFVFKKHYNFFYLLNILLGTRKQLFLTFGPWLLISQYNSGPKEIAILIFIGSIVGFFFRRKLGKLVDVLGERKIIIADYIILSIVALSYAFSSSKYIIFAVFIVDYLMFAIRIAHTTYLKKIILHDEHFMPTISLGITLDHMMSMFMPALGGIVWNFYGPKITFLGFFGLALIGLALITKKRKLV